VANGFESQDLFGTFNTCVAANLFPAAVIIDQRKKFSKRGPNECILDFAINDQ
jgi:hypothetical protein